ENAAAAPFPPRAGRFSLAAAGGVGNVSTVPASTARAGSTGAGLGTTARGTGNETVGNRGRPRPGPPGVFAAAGLGLVQVEYQRRLQHQLREQRLLLLVVLQLLLPALPVRRCRVQRLRRLRRRLPRLRPRHVRSEEHTS